MEENNPLLTNFVFPPYDIIEPRHVRPAMRLLLADLERDLIELESVVEPVWSKLVLPLERITDRLCAVWGIVNHLSAVKSSPELRAAIEEIQPEKVEFQLRLGQSRPIYLAFKTIRESHDWHSLNDAQKRIVQGKLKEANLNGVSLDDPEREKFNNIQQELEKLSLKFVENMLDATKNYEKLITDKKEIEGLPATALAMAAQKAVSKGYEEATAGNGPWVLTLDGPSYRSVMQHVRNRSLREELYRAYIARASSGDFNNTPLIERILELRFEKAKLLGFKNYAEVSMEMKMATIDQAEKLIERLCSACWDSAVKDMEEIEFLAQAQSAMEGDRLNHWDIHFWSERLRECKYDLSEEESRQYFSLPRVLKGLFSLAEMLFDIHIEAADGQAPVWNEDVQFYCIKDKFGNPEAYFYLDPYSRPSEKQGGAWVDAVVTRSRALSTNGSSIRLPVSHIVCNQTPPMGAQPGLMTLREHLLTKQDESLVSGTRGIEWDAVELPSQFMEYWCYQRDCLRRIAQHYQTGRDLPEHYLFKMLSAKTFRSGSEMLRQLRFASIDLELHTKYTPGGSESVYDFDQRVGKKTHVIPLLPEDRFLCSFSHIFHDQYEAGYYSYQWAEVLAADAFSAFEEVGLDNEKAVKEMGFIFRDTVLALGGGLHPLEVFVKFRGREPSPEPLLKYMGLRPVKDAA
uniref:oligopeptidase A n=1 Tax=Kalanchoe fedtschenkoi TaxID=63787 RepID=A0A7N1A6I8_KALFE